MHKQFYITYSHIVKAADLYVVDATAFMNNQHAQGKC
jgi:hypothetical protein